jgi:hypothetical protein
MKTCLSRSSNQQTKRFNSVNTCQTIIQKLQIGQCVNHEWLAIFADVTDGLENPSTDDLARAIAATYFQCSTEPDWNACAKALPEGMETLVHEHQRLLREASRVSGDGTGCGDHAAQRHHQVDAA